MTDQSPSENNPLDAQPKFDVGARLRALRETRGLSQRELARRSHMTNANLSMIEQGRVSPSVATLEKILQSIPLSFTEFFAAEVEPPTVLQQQDFIYIRRGGCQYKILEPPPGSRDFYLAEQTLAPGAAAVGTWLERTGSVAGIVRDGDLTLWLESRCSVLHPGEGFRFHLRRPHKFENCSDIPVVLSLVVSPSDVGREKKV